MRRILTSVFCVALLVSCGGGGGDLTPLSSNATILAFGDSLTFGTGVHKNESYPSVLAERIGRTVINAGIPGEVSAKGLNRLPSLLKQHDPELVVLIHGGNDLLRRQSRSAAAGNLESMIGLAREHGADVVMLGVPQPGLVLSVAPFYEEVAEKMQVPFDGDAIPDILQYPANKSDAVHPNEKGYAMMAEAVIELLEDNGAL